MHYFTMETTGSATSSPDTTIAADERLTAIAAIGRLSTVATDEVRLAPKTPPPDSHNARTTLRARKQCAGAVILRRVLVRFIDLAVCFPKNNDD